MAPPSLAVRHFTFYHEPSLADDNNANDAHSAKDALRGKKSVPVARVTAQVLSFDRRCFWVHLSECRESGNAPPPAFGSCAVAFAGVASEITSAALVDAPPSWQEENGRADVSAPTPQSVFAQSLAQRLARCLQRECGSSGVAVYVACGITGEKVELLGTPAGCSFDVTMRFGVEVFRNVLELLREEVLCRSAA